MRDSLERQYIAAIIAIAQSRVMSLLDDGGNLCDRQEGIRSQHNQLLLSGGARSAYRAETFGYASDRVYNLARVSRYTAVVAASFPVNEAPGSLFAADYPLIALQEFFASLSVVLRE